MFSPDHLCSSIIGPDGPVMHAQVVRPDHLWQHKWSGRTVNVRTIGALTGRHTVSNKNILSTSIRIAAILHRFDAILNRFDAILHRFDAILNRVPIGTSIRIAAICTDSMLYWTDSMLYCTDSMLYWTEFLWAHRSGSMLYWTESMLAIYS